VTVYVFDDSHSLGPITLTRPAIDLRCGVLRLWEKGTAGDLAGLIVADRYAAIMREREPELTVNPEVSAGSAVFLNGRVLDAHTLLPELSGDDCVILDGDRLAAVRLSGTAIMDFVRAVRAGRAQLPEIVDRTERSLRWIEQPWDLITANPGEIEADWQRLGGAHSNRNVHSTATIYAPERVRIEHGATIESGAVLDAREGPIYVGAGAIVHPLSYIQGPASIGADAQVMSGARIREGSSLGPGCRVGGEVEESILQDHSNKYHDGFVGHTYIGSWCNLGALTTTSDLKNTYGTVRLDLEGGTIDSGLTKLGSFISDHVRLGIGTLLTSGCVIGPACNLFGGTLLPKAVDAFQWGGADSLEPYDPDRFFFTAATAMARRGVTLGEAEKELLREIAKAG
jgi:UDP-N-acetylglucosamine diphosphorylase/glucosamine-1-phosphate N-acetyltransferase